jgi:hypothetical protein
VAASAGGIGGNGAGAAGDELAAAAALRELERIRQRDRERNKRWRDGRRAGEGTPPAGGGPSGGAPVHSTRPLAELGAVADAYTRTPPPVESVPLEPADPLAAAKFGALVALLFRVALDDAAARYDLGRLAGQLGAELDASNLEAAKTAAVGFVRSRAERCAQKHGLGVSVPYEDELVTLGAAGGSLAYLAAKFTGRLDSKREPSPSRSGARDDPAGPPIEGDETDGDFAPLRVERGGARR